MPSSQGTRLPDATMGEPGPGWEAWENGGSPGSPLCPPGSYMKVEHGGPGKPYWYIKDPYGMVGSLITHNVEEHDDGTITVTPSVLDPHTYTVEELQEMGVASIVPQGPLGTPGWHGWLERGVWRSV